METCLNRTTLPRNWVRAGLIGRDRNIPMASASDKDADAAAAFFKVMMEPPSFGCSAAAAAYKGRPLKLLCLHGIGGTGEPFINFQLAQMKLYLGPTLVELVAVDGPHQYNDGNGKQGCQWFSDSVSTGFDASLTTLCEAIEAHGPFDGVLGFSQGAATVPLLLAHVPADTFRFAIYFDGYLPGKGDDAQALLDALARARPLKTPALACMSSDQPQWAALGMNLASYFETIEVLQCPGGHDVPRDEPTLQRVAGFLLSRPREDEASSAAG